MVVIGQAEMIVSSYLCMASCGIYAILRSLIVHQPHFVSIPTSLRPHDFIASRRVHYFRLTAYGSGFENLILAPHHPGHGPNVEGGTDDRGDGLSWPEK